jgi:hypothetical protein
MHFRISSTRSNTGSAHPKNNNKTARSIDDRYNMSTFQSDISKWETCSRGTKYTKYNKEDEE